MDRPATLKRPRFLLIALLSATALAVLGCGTGAAGREDSSDRGTGGAAGTAGAGGQGGSASAGAVSLVFVHGKNLYGALLDSPGETRQLSDVRGSKDRLEYFRVSPDGRFVGYVVSRYEPELYRQELMVSSLDEVAEPVLIEASPGGVATDFTWSPDGLRLAYRVNKNQGAPAWNWRIFTSQADGSDKTGVSADGIDVVQQPNWTIAWSPDGSRIAYLAPLPTLPGYVPHTNAWAGNSDRRVTERHTIDLTWRPDGAMLAYVARNSDGALALFTNDAMGASEAEIPDRLHLFGSPSFLWSPDGSRIAYRRKGADGIVELYSRAADGSDERNMTGELQGQGVWYYEWNFDGSRIAYLATQDREDQWDLYTTEVDGSNNKRMSSASDNWTVPLLPFRWSPTDDWIVFLADTVDDDKFSVVVSAGDGSAIYKLSLPGHRASLGSGEEERPWSPDGEYVAFIEESEIGNSTLVTSRRDGTQRRVVYEELDFLGRGVIEHGWSPDGDIAYRADQDDPGLFELYTADRDGSEKQKVSIPGVEVHPGFQWVR